MSNQYPTPAVRVSNASELKAALAAAQGGETILLADGDYGAITISQRFAADVHIVAETQHGARFTGLDVVKAQNVALDGLFLDYDFTPGDGLAKNKFKIADSAGITLRNSLFEGDNRADAADPADGFPTGRGFRLTSSEDILIENNEFRTFWKAMNMSKSADVVIRGNEFHDIRSDGFNLAGSERVRVEYNHFHDFRTNLDTGDHPDMIQIWSSRGLVPRDLTFTGNILDIGAGGSTHGIFIGHNAVSRKAHGDDIAFGNVTITDNVIMGGHVHGISLDVTRGAVVTNNTVLLPPDRADMSPPRIKVDSNSTDVVLTDNMAANFANWEDIPDTWTVSGNIAPQFDAAHQPHYAGDMFINALSGVTNALENLQMLPGSAAALAGVGSSLLTYDPAPDTLTALVRPDYGAFANEIVFDGRFSAGPDGPLDGTGATFHWDFGDGHTGSGAVATHRYGEPGIYTAVLTVTQPDGTSDTTQIVSRIDDPTILSFDGLQAGVLLTTAGDSTVVPGADLTDDGALRFASDTTIVLPRSATSLIENAQGMTLTARVAVEEGGQLIGAKFGFTVSITGQGELRLYTPQETFVTSGADLIDGAAHDIAIRFDGPAGLVRLSVDGAALLEAPAPMSALRDSIDSAIKVGAIRKDGGFTGTIEALDLEINPQAYDFTTPPVGPDDLETAPSGELVSGQLEIGTLAVTQAGPDEWHSVTFTQEITDARVVMGPLSSEGYQAAFAQVRNVTDTGFEFQIDEWDYRDGKHVQETLGWIAASAGSHKLEGGQTLTVGRTTAFDGTPTTTLLEGFDTAPTVLTQTTGGVGPAAAIAQLTEVTDDGFDMLLRTQERSPHAASTQSVDWIALEAADSFVFGERLETPLSHRWQDVGWSSGVEALLGETQTDIGTDPSVLRFLMDETGMLEVRLQEDISADSETNHKFEDVHLIMAQDGLYDLFA